MERVGVDILEPFPVTDSGNRYILVAMDYFKWPETFAILDQSVATTAERLVEEMFTRFGAPAELHSDQGRNFESQVSRAGVQPTHPCCPDVRRELRTPVDFVFGAPPEPEEPSRTWEEYYHRLRNRLLVAHDFARKAQASAGFKQKRWYDTRCRGRAFAAGEQVWVYCPERKKGLLPGRGHLVVLHQDRLAPYRPLATPDAAEPEENSDTALPSEPEPSNTQLSATGRPKRHRRPPGHLWDIDETVDFLRIWLHLYCNCRPDIQVGEERTNTDLVLRARLQGDLLGNLMKSPPGVGRRDYCGVAVRKCTR
ncbi:hypothetical protein SKAU_G00171520 [Synaphobranchus kaupii]|uniref:Integrase catalytic domain-containing protein n=1 Tax=Synaphobranchus kaupii TaxID=118154 RepID=A0A9Q1FKZ9_SYNKA|nr:hypothetical protein SKAU_G00171520 [Synaphobranchus kaupii]